MARPLAPGARIIVLTAVALLGAGTLSQMNLVERFIYFPDSELIASPRDVGLVYQDATFGADDGVELHGWWVPGRRPQTLVWFHGNAGNISHRLDNLRLLHDSTGASILIFDYRGYGRSRGAASESGLYRDARAALRYVRARTDIRRDGIVYFGRSLGSAVALDLAIEEPPTGLILETPFLSVRAMAGRLLPGPLATLVPQGFDNLAKIPSLRCPVLFLHGDRDEIVPYRQGRELYEAAPAPKGLFTIRGAGHNDTYVVGGERYFSRIRDFLDRLEHGGESRGA